MILAASLLACAAGAAIIVWGAETFAEHLGAASAGLGVSSFALALLLAGAEPEELATVVAASLREAPGIALGDVIGANVAICLVALGVGAWIAPLPFPSAVMRYALLGLPIGALGALFVWDGKVGRIEGVALIAAYALYVGWIWRAERAPPALGEAAGLSRPNVGGSKPSRVGRDLALVVLGVTAMAGGAVILVEAVRRISGVETSQTRLGLTLVGFATAFELVVLAWSSARRGMSDVVVAGVAGSFAYNASMTLGAGALARPLRLEDARLLHLPLAAMLGSMLLVVLLASRGGRLGRAEGAVLLVCYPAFVALALRA